MKDEFIGFLRTADLMLAKAVDAAREDWEQGEVMLSPQRADEMNRILKNLRTNMKSVSCVTENFSKLADMRRVTHSV